MVALATLAPPARTQGFTTQFLDRAGAYGAPVNSQVGFDVRNSSTPLFRLAYETDLGGARTLRYATKSGAAGAWAIDSTLTWSAGDVGLAVGASSPYTPHMALNMASGHAYPDPWFGYATKSGSVWSYENVLQRASGADTVNSALSSAICLSSGGTPTVAYSFKRQGSYYYELWLATRGSDPADRWKNKTKVRQSTEPITQVCVKQDGNGVFHLMSLDANSGTLVYSKGTTSWIHEVLGTACGAPALLVDGLTPHVAYLAAGRLTWSYRDASMGWTPTDLRDANGPTDHCVAISGALATPLIAYSYLDSVRVASRTVSGLWNFQRVASNSWNSGAVGVGFYTASGQIKGQVAWPGLQAGSTPVHLVSSGTVYQPNDTAPHLADGEDGWVTDGTLQTLSVVATVRREARGAMVRAEISLGTAGAVRAELLDVMGRRVSDVHAATYAQGTHSVDLRSSTAIRPGIYFVRVTLGGILEAHQKVVVLQ